MRRSFLLHTGGLVDRFALAPDGRTLALTGDEGFTSAASVSLWDVNTGRPKRSRFTHLGAAGVELLGFLPDGATLVTAGQGDGNVFLWDVGTGRVRRVLTTGLISVEHLAVSPDGWTLAVAGLSASDADLPMVAQVEVETRQVQQLGECQVQALTFSPDGKFLATAGGGKVRFWESNNGREPSKLSSIAADGTAVAFSPGETLFATGFGADVALWDSARLLTRAE
jgi:WD40 repeat protein